MIALAMGWTGTLGTIGAYVMLSRGSWHAASLRYAALNGVCGLLAASASVAYGAWPSVASNLLWSCVAAHSVVGTLRQRRSGQVAPVRRLTPEAEPGSQTDRHALHLDAA